MCNVTYLETVCYVCKKNMGFQRHREYVLSKVKPESQPEVWIGHVLRLDDRPAVEECEAGESHEPRPTMGWQKRFDRCAACTESIPVEDRVIPGSVERGEWVMWVQTGWLVLREKPSPSALFGYVGGFGWPARIFRPDAPEDETVPYDFYI